MEILELSQKVLCSLQGENKRKAMSALHLASEVLQAELEIEALQKYGDFTSVVGQDSQVSQLAESASSLPS